MKICILSIGSELLEGSVVDTNSVFISGLLSQYGSAPCDIRMVADDRQVLTSYFKELSSKYDVILTTGGLGPTFDDITAECLADACGVERELNEKAYNHMKACLEKSGVVLRDIHRNQAMLPKGCSLYNNYSGTALGFSMELNGTLIICMPGVPSEMKGMFEKDVLPVLINKFSLKKIEMRNLYFYAIAESEIDNMLREINMEDLQCIINAGSGRVIVKLRGSNSKKIEEISNKLINTFAENYIETYNKSEKEALVELLKSRNETISFAESCSGGLISKLITDVSGASEVFYGGIVSYDNSVKENVLSVPHDTLKEYGAVSYETAKSMAEGVVKLINTDYGVSVTGIAGPNGGSVEKPVGTVYIGVSNGHETLVEKYLFKGDREQVRIKTASMAIFSAVKFIQKKQNNGK